MQLRIETFNNSSGGNAFFKAVTHPLAARAMARAAAPPRRAPRSRSMTRMAAPTGFADLHDLTRLDVAGCFVQDVDRDRPAGAGPPGAAGDRTRRKRRAARLRRRLRRRRASSTISAISCRPAPRSSASTRSACPRRCCRTRARYLDPLNFATNFVFFRDAGRAAHAARHGELLGGLWRARAGTVAAALRRDRQGDRRVARGGAAPAAPSIVLDSRAIRARFGLPGIHRPALHACRRRASAMTW